MKKKSYLCGKLDGFTQLHSDVGREERVQHGGNGGGVFGDRGEHS